MTENIEARVETVLVALNAAIKAGGASELTEIRDRLRNPIKMALAGEFSSGKTTLARMLLGRDFVTTKAAASAMPTVRFHFGDKDRYILRTDGEDREIDGIEALTLQDMRAAEDLIIETEQPLLKQIEIFDTPGTSDPTRDSDQIVDVANQVEFIIWCTNATQAWRQSERAMWEALPQKAHDRSLLVVTHVDLPKVKASLDRLMKRMNKEAGPMFHKVLAVDLLTAIKSRFDAQLVNNPVGWQDSGGAACLSTIMASVANVRAAQVTEAEALLGGSVDLVEEVVAPEPVDEAVVASFVTVWEKGLAEVKSLRESPVSYFEFLSQMRQGDFGDWQEPAAVAAEIDARLDEACDFVKTADSTEVARDVIEQLDWEFRNIVVADMVA